MLSVRMPAATLRCSACRVWGAQAAAASRKVCGFTAHTTVPAAASRFMLGRLDNGGAFGSSGFAGTGVETTLRLDAEVLAKLDAIFPGPGGEAPKAYAW